MPLQSGNTSPFWSPEIARKRSVQDYLQMNDTVANRDYEVEPLKQFDWASKANQFRTQAAQTNYQGSLNAINNAANSFNSPAVGGGGGNLGGGNPRLAAVLRALRTQESGGNYSAVNSGSGALGAYQVMPSNLAGSGGWDMEALNRNISSQQFLQSRQLQNAIARYKFGNYMRQYGVRGALSAWYSGDPNRWKDDSGVSSGPSVHDYVMHVLSLMGR